MKGDFSKLGLARRNYTGVLHQQGRVLLDQDWNASQFIASRLRDLMAEDVIGADAAAVPAALAGGFRVTQANATAAGVTVTVTPGRLWLEGLAVELDGTTPLVLDAPYFGPPVQSPQADTSTIADGVTDAVILEAWEETLNAFQVPLELLEPVLGGADTTERIQAYFRLRLLRLGPGEDCHSIASRLDADPGSLGHLTVTAAPVVVIGGDCPVETGGGYTGLEHYLYRIEVASPSAAADARFKWSRFNGGLAGRGSINATGDTVNVIANAQMINLCGLTDFYLEALQQPAGDWPWNIVFTAHASLASDGVLSLTQQTGAWPAAAGVPVFFRLWDGVRRIADFAGAATILENGIQLQFDAPVPANGATNYRPGDYWTFPVRAAGTGFDPSVWPSNASPAGIHYRRAPLAEIIWPGPAPVAAVAPADIDDCRRHFPPLTRLRVCCTYMVGDGVSTFGDYNSIQEAIDNLPARGGQICLMPGTHRANAVIRNRRDIKIHGCGIHSRVIPLAATPNDPVFHIIDSSNIEISELDVFTSAGTGFILEGSEAGAIQQIEIVHTRIVAGVSAILVGNGAEIGIRYNRIRVIDRVGGLEAIVVMAEGAWIERNDIGVVAAERNPPTPPGRPPDRPRPEDPCFDLTTVNRNPNLVAGYLHYIFLPSLVLVMPTAPYRALGGIRVSSGSERIVILENAINGGAGDGINLGGVVTLPGAQGPPSQPGISVAVASNGFVYGIAQQDAALTSDVVVSIHRADLSGPELYATSGSDGQFYVQDRQITPGTYVMRAETPGYQIASISTRPTSLLTPSHITVNLARVAVDDRVLGGAAIREVRIERNLIENMGLSGIGSSGRARTGPTGVRLTNIYTQLSIPIFDIEIDGNLIRHCLQNPFDNTLLAVAQVKGIGGVSLGVCDEVIVSRNRIEDNGTSHINPVTGIFAALADHIEVHGNMLHGNGPFDAASTQTLHQGIRGGVVLRAMARVEGDTSLTGKLGIALDQPAARVYDNMVRQPAGQALQILALGPVAVTNNFFSSDRRGPAALEILAGVALILNYGTREVSGIRAGFQDTLSMNALQVVAADGKTLFHGNQLRLGPAGNSFFGQLMWTRGDLGYYDNQADYLGTGLRLSDGLTTFINTFLVGNTVRAGDSRFKEGRLPARSPVFSLLTFSQLLNNTSDNQGDHCIAAFNGGPVPVQDSPNQVLDSTFCPQSKPIVGRMMQAKALSYR